jgi:HSP20 family protein
MTLMKWNPLRELETMERDMSRLFSRLGGDQSSGRWLDSMRFDGGQQEGRQHWTLATDVIETEHELKLRAALPGVDPKDVNVQVEDGVLTISAERRFEDKQESNNYCWIEQQYGSFSRSLALPKYADAEKIEASYNNGVLELTIPKMEAAKPRKIELNVGQSTPAIEAEASESHSSSPATESSAS